MGRLDTYDWSVRGLTRQDGRESKYPWGEWSDGKIWQIFRGQDYEITDEMMTRTLYQRAHKWKLAVRVRKTPEGIVFQFYKRQEKR